MNKPKPHKEVCPYMPIRLVRTDTYGHSSLASAVQTTFCGSPVSGKWLAVPIPVPLSTKRKIERIEYESVNKLKPPKRSVSVYAYPTCSDRHIRTFFFGFGGTDNLLWLTREWQVVGCTYQFRFQQETKGASGKGGCAVRKIIRTSIVKPSV